MQERAALWKDAFEVDEHSVNRALSDLAWNVTAFSCLVEAVRQAPDTPDGGKRLNGLLLGLLAEGFWASTMQAVRRLADRSSLHGARGVYSIGSILGDVRAVRHQLTRQVYVEVIAGLPYDVDAVRRSRMEFIFRQPPNSVYMVPRELQYELSERRHSEFDALSGVAAHERTSGDLILVDVLDRLDARLDRLNGVVQHATLVHAHSASSASRAGRTLDAWGLSDAKLALKELSQVAELVGRWFCYSGLGNVLPVPQFDQFAHLEEAMFTGDVDVLQKVWDEMAEESEGWTRVEVEDL